MGWKTLGLKEAIKEMLHDSGMTQKGVCEAAGDKSVGSIVQLKLSRTIKKKNPKNPRKTKKEMMLLGSKEGFNRATVWPIGRYPTRQKAGE